MVSRLLRTVPALALVALGGFALGGCAGGGGEALTTGSLLTATRTPERSRERRRLER